MAQISVEERNEKVREESAFVAPLLTAVESVIVGQPEMVRRILVGLLADGHLLLAVSKSKEYPGGAVVEIDREGKTLFEFKGTQSEVNTVQALPNGNLMLTEAGNKPRLLEIDRTGKTIVDVPLQCQTQNHHMESRMSRKLANGNYLIDFNFTYNPACAYSDHYNCPIPPKANVLPVAIRAGQMNAHYH